MVHSKKIGAGLACCLLAALCACQPAVDSGRLDAAMSEARLGALSRPASSSSQTISSSAQSASSAPAASSQPAASGPTTAELAEEIQIPIVGDKLTEDPQYIPTEEEMRQDDPQYNQPAREEPEEEIVDTLPPVAPPSSSAGTSGMVSVPSQMSSADSSTATSDTAASTPDEPAPADGWYEKDGNTYFYVNGQPVTGWQTAGGFKYYFDGQGVLSSKVGIDVSVYQGNIDWNAVKAAGVEFAMIRVGYRGYGQAGNMKLDANFVKNLEGAQAAGIDCGVYFFSQAITRAEAVEEAKFVLEAIKGYDLTYPVAFDTEYYPLDEARTNQAGLTDADRTDFAIDFCQTIRDAGYYPTIYASKSWLLDDMEIARLADWDIWLAHYTNQTDFQYPYQMWQYSQSGQVSGITENTVDLNVGLKDYAKVIEAASAQNLARGAAVSASSAAEGLPAAAAADGWASGTSRWSPAAGDGDPYLLAEFEEKRAVGRVWCAAAGGPAPYALEYWDGADWQVVCTGDDIGYSRTLTFPAVYTDKMRLHILDETAADSGLSVWEWALYLDVRLAGIQLGDYPLPGFAADQTAYTVTLPAGVTLPVTGTVDDPADTVTVEQTEDGATVTLTSPTGGRTVYTLHFAYVDDPAALAVFNQIEALPDQAEEADRPDVEAARAAYEQLDGTGKAAILNLSRLEAAERQLIGILPGDLDGDVEVTIADVMEACKVMARESAGTDPTDDEIARGDLDGDGEITIADVMEICKILARGA